MEQFQVLDRFLSSSKDQLLKELLSITQVDKNSEEVAVKLAQINLLGSIQELPKLVKAIKDAIEKEEVKFAGMKAQMED